ncbi:MAG TPA: cytochrome D1 domain-containing protein, partial [Burkholderiales bacterium]|nr:cytochrome D1 domain-containing protein [Burkholderiales bacterium]
MIAPAAISQADPLEVLFVVGDGGASITVFDGERLAPVRRFATQRSVTGPPRFTPDARFVFFASIDGWIVKYDLRTFSAVAEFRAGGEAPRFAVSHDGKHVAVSSESPRGLAILDADLRPRKVLASSSRVSGVLDAARRRSFVVALQDLPELWEVSYDPKAEPIAEGVVHDFRLKEGTFVEGFLNPRRTKLEQPLDDVIFLADGSLVVGMQRHGGAGLAVQLDIRRPIAVFDLAGSTGPASGTTWSAKGRRFFAIPSAQQAVLTIVDLADGKIVKRIATAGPGSLARSHEATGNLWIDATSGKARDTLQLVDKDTLEV